MGNCCPRILGRGSTTEEDKDLDQALLSSPEGKKVTAEHFKILKVIYVILFSSISIFQLLGEGSFGKVYLVEKKDTSNQKSVTDLTPFSEKKYAMKVLNKAQAKRKRQALHNKREREILASMECPFIVTLHYAFQTQHKLYMVMDFMPGGKKIVLFQTKRALWGCIRRVIYSSQNSSQILRSKS